MRLSFKVNGTIVGEEKISYNLQIDQKLVCVGVFLDKGMLGSVLKTYFEKSIKSRAKKLIDISATQDKTFFTWKSFDKMVEKTVPAQGAK